MFIFPSKTKYRPMYALMVLAVAVTGCGNSDAVILQKLSRDFDLENMTGRRIELELGSYRIASAVPEQKAVGNQARPQWVQIRFHLYAMVDPEDVQRVKDACERHRGTLDDTILTVCRGATIEELVDVRNATLRARLIDAIRPILGSGRIHQISFADTFTWEPI